MSILPLFRKERELRCLSYFMHVPEHLKRSVVKPKSLFDFSFFIDNMLTNNRIKFFDLHFFWHCAFVFGCGIKVTSAFGRNQFNFIAHFSISLNFSAVFTQIRQHSVYAVFINDTHCLRGNSKAHPTIFAFYPESVMLQIWKKTSFGSVVCV
jgi:hypothetical protein